MRCAIPNPHLFIYVYIYVFVIFGFNKSGDDGSIKSIVEAEQKIAVDTFFSSSNSSDNE